MTSGIKDEMENSWGVDYLIPVPKAARKSFNDLKALVASTIMGFHLVSLCSSGTEVNMAACLMCTDYDISRCFFGLGSYVGGDHYTQGMSSSMYDTKHAISFPKLVENASPECLHQTVPLPYHIPESIGVKDKTVRDHEVRCLRSLHKKLIMATLKGKPVRALLVELVLSGNGCILSQTFLAKLGALCVKMNVDIVVDEVLTGGRVGPGMVMTTSMPPEFVAAVRYITMGKFIGCGFVLEKDKKSTLSNVERIRGTSTSQDPSVPYAIWREVYKRIQEKQIDVREDEVWAAMKVANKENRWSAGLIMFSSSLRWQTLKSLKMRLLPQLAPGVGIRKGPTRKSQWTRTSVTEAVMEVANEWLIAQDGLCNLEVQGAFLSQIVDYIFFVAPSQLEPDDSNQAGYVRFRAEDVVRFMGPKKAESLAETIRAMKHQMGFQSKMKPETFVQGAVLHVCRQTCQSDLKFFVKKRKTAKRKEFTFVLARLFGIACKSSGQFMFFS